MLCVIDPGIVLPELDCFNQIALRWKKSITFHTPGMFGFDSLSLLDFSLIKGVIILGSEANVNDNFPWQKPLESWITRFIDKAIPTLAICYGHQLVAHMYGSKVARYGAEKQLGARLIEFPSGAAMHLKKTTYNLVVSHNEVVVDAPSELKPFGRSPLSPFESFYIPEKNLWTIQPHPEATPNFCKKMPPIKSETFRDGRDFVNAFLSKVT